MLLNPNACFFVTAETSVIPPGVYRVILDDPVGGVIVAAHIMDDRQEPPRRGGRKKKAPQDRRTTDKKPPPPLVGDLKWVPREELRELWDEGQARDFEILRPKPRKTLSATDQELYERRLSIMRPFLDLPALHEDLVVHGSIAPLIKRTIATHSVSNAFVRRMWSTLCRWGFDEASLIPRRDLSGAPGKSRPCDPGGREKAGRKTTAERNARAYGQYLPPLQPGCSSEWAAAVRAADKRIKCAVKPAWPDRYKRIIHSAFCGKAQEIEGRIQYVAPTIGTIPNLRQVKRILTRGLTKIERILERTTKRHFTSAKRGLTAHDWEGVPGPGHTWAIDSTIADIYLRSSVNRSWIVGRPVVYVIVDVWSTAVVGFYICLTGPSWDTAKTAIFNAAAPPNLLGEIWGYEPVVTLHPHPTICYQLWCDRGEYLSRAHKVTAFNLIPHTSYTPPYRGDLKGIVEVLHRITKDEQFLFLPGAMNYRREEMELRRVRPEDCALTVAEYTAYLHEVFAEYNLTANREHRLDADMIADDVFPSPAGIWAWGHHVGIGYRKHLSEYELMEKLLPEDSAVIRRDGIRFFGCQYSSDEIDISQLTCTARNLGSLNMPVRHYPGPIGRIWTPDPERARMIRLDLRDDSRASPEFTQDEWNDVIALQTMRRPYQQHESLSKSLDTRARIDHLKAEASRKTGEAIENAEGPQPSMTEARKIEASENKRSHSEKVSPEQLRDEALDAHEAMCKALLECANYAE